jgi:hypothetical protein
MSKQMPRRRTASAPSPFDEARDELMQHVISCGVMGAEPEDQQAWFDESMQYFRDRYPELGSAELAQLRQMGERFAQPPKMAATVA